MLDQLGLTTEQYVLATIHRPENTDDPAVLETILRQLVALPVPVVLPLHPRTQHHIITSGLAELTGLLRVTGPLDYPALLALIRHTRMVISDSGGIQEETTVLKRPILVVRRSNERPEAENTFGARVLPGPGIWAVATRWLSRISVIHDQLATLASPYGDGTASAQIVHALRSRYQQQHENTHHAPKTA